MTEATQDALDGLTRAASCGVKTRARQGRLAAALPPATQPRSPHLLGLLNQLLRGEGKRCTRSRRARQHRGLHRRRHAGGGGGGSLRATERGSHQRL